MYRIQAQNLDRLYGDPLPYISAWHQAPLHVERDLMGQHLELRAATEVAA